MRDLISTLKNEFKKCRRGLHCGNVLPKSWHSREKPVQDIQTSAVGVKGVKGVLSIGFPTLVEIAAGLFFLSLRLCQGLD